MFGRKILPLFVAAAVSAAVSCSLNPQPEPPFSNGVSDKQGGDYNGGGTTVSDPTERGDGGVLVSNASEDAPSGRSPDGSPDGSTASEGDAIAVDQGDAGAEAGESSVDASSDASEGDATGD
jgi:hypothetical protein